MSENNVTFIEDKMGEGYEVLEGLDRKKDVHKVDRLKGKSFRVAIQLGNLNYQVHNGGFSQWELNGYSVDVDDLLDIANDAVQEWGSTFFKNLEDILMDFDNLPEIEEEEVEEECFECDNGVIVDDCSTCDGMGEDDDGEECPDCDGEGEEESTCFECDGSGYVSVYESNEDEIEREFNRLDDRYYAWDEDKIFEEVAKAVRMYE